MTDIHVLDLDYLGQPESIASYLIDAPDGPILVETGPGSTTDALTRGLAAHGYAPGDVKHVLVTHIHFDHAGAAGWMVDHGATLHVHAFGAKHMIDPSKLIASATRIYQERMATLWGDILPCPAERVNAVEDGDELHLNGITLRAIETPGHARHHHAFALKTNDGHVAFTGDAAATFIAAAPEFISVPTPPPEFDLDTWLATLERLRGERFDRIYPTHFGAVDDVDAHLTRTADTLRAHTDFVLERRAAGADRAAIVAAYGPWFLADAERHTVPARYHGFYVKDSLTEMNVTGILRYADQRDASATTS